MVMLKKILAPTDFSELSVRGVRYACELAKDVGAEVTILNVVTVDESGINKGEMGEHKQRLDEFVAKNVADVVANLRISKLVDAGQAYVAIIDCAENERIDLIVISSHGRSGLSRMLIGSVTDKVLRGASCPVLVVPLEKES
jgi:nucleotide-binding universal stress UspA family protein